MIYQSCLLNKYSLCFHFILCLTCRGEVMNGGFGLLLDGSEEAAKRATLMLNWDVSNGVRVYKEEQLGWVQPHLLFKVRSDNGWCLIYTDLCDCVCCRWLVAAGLETRMPLTPSRAPWRSTGSCVSPCLSLYRMSMCWTVPCRDSQHFSIGFSNSQLHIHGKGNPQQ